MKSISLLIVMLLFSIVTNAQKIPPDKLIGIWQSYDSNIELKFEFFREGNKFFGKLLYASTMYEADGKTPKKDIKNPDKNLRSRSRKDMVNITNLVYKGSEYKDGKIYIPDWGETFALKAKLKTENEMEYRFYYSFSLIGRTVKFKRIA